MKTNDRASVHARVDAFIDAYKSCRYGEKACIPAKLGMRGGYAQVAFLASFLGLNRPRKLIKTEDDEKIRQAIREGDSVIAIARKFGISRTSVYAIKHRTEP